MTKMFRILVAVLIGIGAGAPIVHAAADFPDRVITIIVPFAAGSPTDVVGRQAAQAISQGLGKQVIVEDRPGAGGIVGTLAVAQAPADGTRLLIITNSTHAANVALFKSLPYDPVKDFTPISNLNFSPMLLLAHPSVPARSLAELTAYGRANPGRLTIGESGASTIIAASKLMALGKFEATKVPYQSIPPAMKDLIGGHISLSFADYGAAASHLKSKTLIALGVTSLTRSPLTPDVPTLDEAGLSGFDVSGWQGIAAPAKTDRALIEKIFAAIKTHYDTAAVRERFNMLGLVVGTSASPPAYADFIARETERWSGMVKAAGIPPQ